MSIRDRVLDAGEVRRLYDRIAPGYDTALRVYEALGARRLARRGVALLEVEPGATVVDLGCGTGANLASLAAAVGRQGRVVGVDLSSGMLDRARRRRLPDEGGRVDLVQADIREFELPPDTTGVISTFAMEMVPEHGEIVARVRDVLTDTHGRMAISGLRRPPRWPEWAVRLAMAVNRPFGVNPAYEQIRPWESIQTHMREVTFESILFDAVYLSVGQA